MRANGIAVESCIVGLLFALLCLLMPGAARADIRVAEDRARARDLARTGYQALETKDYKVAEDAFRRADALVHAPTITVDHARSLVGLHRLVEARDNYLLVLREGVRDDAPDSWKEAHQDAVRELPTVEARLAWVAVAVSGVESPSVSIGGQTIGNDLIGKLVTIDPGDVELRVSAEGFADQVQTVSLKEGEQRRVDFNFKPPSDEGIEVINETEQPTSSILSRFPAWFLGGIATILVGALLMIWVRRGWFSERAVPLTFDGRKTSDGQPVSDRRKQSLRGKRIFISYRRDDTRDVVGRIDDHLVHWFGRQAVFLDVDAIPIGVDYRKHIDQNLFNCSAVLAVVGTSWLRILGRQGTPRLHEQSDHLRLELEAALRRQIPIIPVLVHSARMPDEDELPESLRDFHFLQAATIDPDPHFARGMDRLIAKLEGLMIERRR